MTLTQEQRDFLDQIEKLVYKNSDDIAISMAQSFERLDEKIDAMESRMYSRIGDIEDALIIKEDANDELRTQKVLTAINAIK